MVRGDTEAAFARDDVVIVESCFRVGRQNHVSLEPRAVIASYEDGRYHIETSTQGPWTVRDATAQLLGVPASRVRVTVPPVGGGFGQKFDCTLEPYAAILAQKSGRPVRLVYTRQEEMLTCRCRENAEIKLRSAVTRSGDILGREAVVLMDCGAYGGEQIFLTTMTAHTLGGNYRLGVVKLASRAIYTNTPPNGAFRACNGVYNTFALERHTDEICQAIGMDPFAFRRKNVLRDGDVGATGQVFQGDVLGPMLDTMARIRNASPARKPLAGNRLYGRATVVGTWFIFVGPATATINLNADGGATLITAGVELGQGTMVQSVPQIVAHELGIDLPVFSVHDCELAVDAETGKVDILAYRVVQDVGRAINPRAIRGQIQGGVTQGIGYALHEELTIGAAGCMQQNTLGVYRVPLAQDTIPVEAELYEGAPWIGPLGVKEAGEIPIMCAPAAIACAVANATGLRVQETPLTPPRVLGLILGREPELTLRHISPDWWDNVFRRRNA